MTRCPVQVDGQECTSGQRIVLGTCLYHYKQKKRGAPYTSHVPKRPRGSSVLRDHLGRKECSRCLSWKPTTSFTPSANSPDRLQVWCSQCASDYMLTRRYRMDSESILRMVGQQGGCDICKASQPRNPGFRNGWHVDHDHACCPGDISCGACIRSVLCGDCNKMIGLAEDDPERLRAAADYLERHSMVARQVA